MSEVASAFVTLIPSARGFAKKLDAQIGGDVDRSGRDAGKRFATGMQSSVGGMATKVFAPLAAAAGGIALGGFFKDAISGASDLAETSTKLDAIFGDASKSVQAFGKKGAKALGQSQQAVLDSVATFGTFGRAAGLGGEKLAEFSTGFAGLATDLASFNNTSPEEAVAAIGSALRGEAEPLRKYGVLLDDATLKSEALKLGLIKTTKDALTPQQKVLAAQAAIYKQTSTAQGDFDRTSGGLANQQRILSAQFTDLKTTLGKGLLPVVTGVVTFFNDRGIPALKNFGDSVKGALGSETVKDFAGGAKQIYDSLFRGDFTGGGPFSEDSPFIDKVFDLREALGTLKDGATQVYNSLFRGDFTGGGPFAEDSPFIDKVFDVREALLGFSDGVADRFEDMRDRVKTVFDGLFDSVRTGDFSALGAAIGTGLASAVESLATNQARLVAGIGNFFRDVAPELAVEFGKQAPTILLGLATGLLNFDIGSLLGFLGDHLVEVIVGIIVLAFAPAKLLGLFAKIPFIGPLIAALLRSAAAASKGILSIGGRIVTGLLDGLERSAPAMLGGAIGLLRSLGVVLVTYGRLAVEGLLGLLRGTPGAARTALSALPGMLGRIAGDGVGLFLRAITFLPRQLLGLLRPVGATVLRGLGNIGGVLFQAGKDLIGGLIRGAGSVLKDLGRFFLDKVPSWIRTPFKKALGINSPSKVFLGYGVNIGDGLRLGIERTRRDLGATMRDLVPEPSTGALRGMQPGAAAAGGGGLQFRDLIVQDRSGDAARTVPMALRQLAYAQGL